MKNNLDTVIIGAGISGLTAGALLAKRGKKVLLLESNPQIGGYLSGFIRKGYYFDAGIARSNISYVEPYLRKAGVLDSVHFIKIDGDYHVNGHYVPYGNLREFFHAVADTFPDQKGGILSFYDREVAPREKKMKTMMYSDFRNMGWIRMCITILKIIAGMPAMMGENSSKENENDLLKRYVDENSDAFAFLCTRPDQINHRGYMTPTFYVARLLSQLYNYYPQEGYLHLCNLLKQVVLDNGGELLTNSRVSKIEIEHNVATGVEYRSKGQILTARAATVLSAIDMHKTFHELVGADIVPPVEMKKLNDSVLGSSIPILFLGLRIPSDRMRQIFNGKEELNYFPSIRRLDADLSDIGFFAQCSMVIHSSSLVNATHAPPGCSNVQIYLDCPPVSWQQDWRLADGQPAEQYRQLKRKVVEDVISLLERLIPELKDRSIIDVCELGTPHTNERYTGNTHGVACGFNYDGYRLSAARMRSYYSRLSNVRNLFFIGHQTGYGGGLVVALGSAQRVTNEILHR